MSQQNRIFTSNAANLLILNEKGGSRKTSLASVLIAIAVDFGAKPLIIEVDDQVTLAAIYPDLTSVVRMPASDDLLEDDQADIAALSPAFEVLSAPNESLAVVDIGANLDGRIVEAMQAADLAQAIENAGRKTIALIPFLPGDADSILAATRSAKRIQLGLPGAEVVFCLCHDGAEVSIQGKVKAAWSEVIAPLIAKNGLMEMSRLRPRALQGFKTVGLSHSRFIAHDAAAIAKSLGVSPFVAGAMQLQMQIFVTEMAMQAEKFLGFRLGEDTQHATTD